MIVGYVFDSVSVSVFRTAAVDGVDDVVGLRYERTEHEQQGKSAEEIKQPQNDPFPLEFHGETTSGSWTTSEEAN